MTLTPSPIKRGTPEPTIVAANVLAPIGARFAASPSYSLLDPIASPGEALPSGWRICFLSLQRLG